MNNIEGRSAAELDLKCMPLHASTTPSISPCASFSWPGAVYFSISGALSKQGPHPYSPTSNSSAYLPPTLKKTSLCSPLHIHTYINTSLWRQRCWGRRGLGIKITLNSKQRIVGPWQVDGLSASHTCFRITPLWHANHQTGRAALGERSRCVSQVPAVQRIWSREVWYTNCELVDDTVWVIRG